MGHPPRVRPVSMMSNLRGGRAEGNARVSRATRVPGGREMWIDRVRGRGIAAALPILLVLSAAGCSRESLAETGGTRAEAALADVRPDEMWSIVESFSKLDRTSSRTSR